MAVKSYKNFIGGEWKTSSSGETFKNVNPANAKEVVGRFQQSTLKDVNEAVSAARSASSLAAMSRARSCQSC